MKLKKTNVVNVSTLADVKTEVVAEESTRDEKFEELDIKNSDIESLISKAYNIHEHSTDYLVHEADNYNVRFNDFAGLTFLVDGDEIHELPISRFALGQLSAKVGVPLRYLEKCVSSGRIDLAKDNINSWLEDYKKDLFIREYNGCIRGVLSSKYSVCDSHEILDIVGNTIDLNNYKVKGSFLNDERLHVRLVSKEMLPIDNEDLFAGLFIDSSDVGRNTFTVQFGIYKQVCTNGLVVSRGSGVLFQQKHIGISAEDFAQGLRTSLENSIESHRMGICAEESRLKNGEKVFVHES